MRLLWCCVLLAVVVAPAVGQVAWTPIYVDGNSQIDLWTQKATGCRCPFDATRNDCACCVRDGGCHCGRSSPNRCTQCGLEQHCSNVCNMTIDSKLISARSGKTFGQIKPPAMEGPVFCWYLLQPDVGQRVEVQIYRLISVGKFNGTSCDGGFLQLVDGAEAASRPGATQVCGGNERYTPPVVLFADRGPATLLFQIPEPTARSQFFAYFSFTSREKNKQGVGFQPKGGTRVEPTECDWLYQDFHCSKAESCVLASPGYPGVYPPNRTCKYLITTSTISKQVTITFKSLLLPHSHCGSDYISVYQGSTPSSPLLTTLCANKKTQLQYMGPNLLLEFSSGAPVPPYDYSGFLAVLEFSDKATTTTAEPATTRTTELSVLMDGTVAPRAPTRQPPPPPPAHAHHADCELVFSGNESRSGHFDTRGLPWAAVCRLVFLGRRADVVQISLFNHKLRTPSCTAAVEVIDGLAARGVKPVKKICGPSTKHARDPGGRFFEPERFVSTDNTLTLLLKRSVPSVGPAEVEFVDGAFLFHDERASGTPKPDSFCDVDYYGLSSAAAGTVGNPGGQDLFWNVEGALRCSQRFIPATNQSVTVTVWSLSRLSADSHCQTQCGDGGCQCVANLLPLAQMDHLLLVTDAGRAVSCLCGDFDRQGFPVSLRTWSPLRLVYSVAHYSWNMKGFAFNASFSFVDDAVCGHSVVSQPSGEIRSRDLNGIGKNANFYYHQECTWLLDSKVERQLVIELVTSQTRPCSAWNVSVHRYESNRVGGAGDLLHTFCPRDLSKQYALPWKLDTVLLRLRAMTQTPPVFAVRWRSQLVQANTRVSGPAAASAAPATAPGLAVALVIVVSAAVRI